MNEICSYLIQREKYEKYGFLLDKISMCVIRYDLKLMHVAYCVGMILLLTGTHLLSHDIEWRHIKHANFLKILCIPLYNK